MNFQSNWIGTYICIFIWLLFQNLQIYFIIDLYYSFIQVRLLDGNSFGSGLLFFFSKNKIIGSLNLQEMCHFKCPKNGINFTKTAINNFHIVKIAHIYVYQINFWTQSDYLRLASCELIRSENLTRCFHIHMMKMKIIRHKI